MISYLEGLKLWFSGEYNWICQPVDYSTSKQVNTHIKESVRLDSAFELTMQECRATT